MDSDSRKDHHPNLISEIFDASLFGEPEAKYTRLAVLWRLKNHI